jgi:hypothetical protein
MGRRVDLEQLDAEHQHAQRLAEAAAVGELDGNPETPLLTHDHLLQTFGQTANDLVQRNSLGCLRITELSNTAPSVVHPV